MKFAYKQIGPYLRPIIPVGISYKGIEFEYEVLVDSGADACVFDIEVADALEMDLSKCKTEEIFGITGDHEKAYI